jgi:transposase-like protein
MARLTLRQLAAILGVSYSTMRRMSGGDIQRKYTEEQRQQVLALLATGLCDAEVSRHTDIPKSTVRYWRIKHDTTTTTAADAE